MKKTTFLPKIDGIRSHTPLPGFAATVLGVPVVVHRPLRHGKLDKNGGWVISEPTSGMGVAQWKARAKTKEGALYLAEQFLKDRGMTGDEFAAYAGRCAAESNTL